MYVTAPYVVSRGMGAYGAAPTKKKKGGLFRKIKKFKFGRFLRRTALPIAAGGIALKAGVPLARKGLRTLFRKKGPAVTTITPEGPVVTPGAEVAPGGEPSVVETVARTAAEAAKVFTRAPEIPGVTPTAEAGGAAEVGGEVMQAGMFGAGGGKTLLLLSAVGLGALLLSKRR